MKIPKNAKKLNHNILRHGEHTGHKHQILTAETQSYDLGNDLILSQVAVDARVVHEEHHTIMLPAGEYLSGGTNGYDHLLEESRQVLD
jgi:hypothetical protein